MPSTQTTLTDTDGDPEPTDDATPMTTTATESGRYTTLAPPDKRGGTGCCPWCLAAPETFEHYGDGRVGCGYCDAAIPIGVPWYERGEKIILAGSAGTDTG